MLNNQMDPMQLKSEIKNFLMEHKEGSLATTMSNRPRTSPVQYFTDDNMNIYIASAGGDKFKAIDENPNVCLLVNTEYINYRKIKGVQVFGRATTSMQDPGLLQEAKQYTPEPYMMEHEGNLIKVIKVVPEEIVYLNSVEDGNRTKQILKNDQVMIKEDNTLSIH